MGEQESMMDDRTDKPAEPGMIVSKSYICDWDRIIGRWFRKRKTNDAEHSPQTIDDCKDEKEIKHE